MVTQTKAKGPVTKQPPKAEGAIMSAEEPKKKKKRRSKRLKNHHRMERSSAKAMNYAGDAITKGLKRYSELREKSASKKKNGAIKDSAKNMGKALKIIMKGSHKAHRHMGKGLFSLKMNSRDRKKMERSMKDMTRMMGARI
ncbi:MAG: hypothetical protein GKR87_06070 [Kiritimatiellae bacterium]|nr:hypothetical protein [Kiritimatiellia bacterium]